MLTAQHDKRDMYIVHEYITITMPNITINSFVLQSRDILKIISQHPKR